MQYMYSHPGVDIYIYIQYGKFEKTITKLCIYFNIPYSIYFRKCII